MQKIKQFIESEKGKDFLVVIIVILVGLGSFELGRLSKGNQSSGIKIEYTNTDSSPLKNQESSIISASQALASSNNAGKNFFASSKGSKYYPVGCSAGKSLKLENRVYFETKEQAEKAGYALSSACQ